MGGLCGKYEHGADFISFQESPGEIRLLIVALNYDYVPGAELTCHKDAHTMFRIADRAKVTDITLNTDRRGPGSKNFPTRSVVLKHIAMTAKQCRPDDWFVWFWAGHGVNVPDKTEDEVDGYDQAFVTPDDQGRLTEKSVLLDDQFAEALETCVPERVRILCICDCCHSGTICDIDSYRYTHDIYQISASQDDEEAEDIGGGVLTVALRRAVRQLSLKYKEGREFSIQEVFDLSKKYAQNLTKEQELSLQWRGPHPSLVAWPLGYPWTEYMKLKEKDRRERNIFDLETEDDVLREQDDDLFGLEAEDDDGLSPVVR